MMVVDNNSSNFVTAVGVEDKQSLAAAVLLMWVYYEVLRVSNDH